MKFKSFLLLSLLSFNCYSDDGINLNCEETSWFTSSKGGKLHGDGNFYLYNNTGSNQAITYAITICSPNRECATNQASGISIPGSYISPPLGIWEHTTYSTYGSVYYDVYFSVWGFKPMHTEKRCILRVLDV